MANKTLSDKTVNTLLGKNISWIKTKDVKEFIKKLKKEISKIDDYNTRYSIPAFEIIDKLAGEDLI